jgi:hypothetical protein
MSAFSARRLEPILFKTRQFDRRHIGFGKHKLDVTKHVC